MNEWKDTICKEKQGHLHIKMCIFLSLFNTVSGEFSHVLKYSSKINFQCLWSVPSFRRTSFNHFPMLGSLDCFPCIRHSANDTHPFLYYVFTEGWMSAVCCAWCWGCKSSWDPVLSWNSRAVEEREAGTEACMKERKTAGTPWNQNCYIHRSLSSAHSFVFSLHCSERIFPIYPTWSSPTFILPTPVCH